LNVGACEVEVGFIFEHAAYEVKAIQWKMWWRGIQQSGFLLELANNGLFLVMRQVVPEDGGLVGLFFFDGLGGEDQLDILGYLVGQPEFSLYEITLDVKALINALNDYDYFGHFRPRVPQVLLLDVVWGHFQPVLKVPPQFFLVEIDPLLDFEVVLDRVECTLSSIMIL
jgi:hypothetical protein